MTDIVSEKTDFINHKMEPKVVSCGYDGATIKIGTHEYKVCRPKRGVVWSELLNGNTIQCCGNTYCYAGGNFSINERKFIVAEEVMEVFLARMDIWE